MALAHTTNITFNSPLCSSKSTFSPFGFGFLTTLLPLFFLFLLIEAFSFFESLICIALSTETNTLHQRQPNKTVMIVKTKHLLSTLSTVASISTSAFCSLFFFFFFSPVCGSLLAFFTFIVKNTHATCESTKYIMVNPQNMNQVHTMRKKHS